MSFENDPTQRSGSLGECPILSVDDLSRDVVQGIFRRSRPTQRHNPYGLAMVDRRIESGNFDAFGSPFENIDPWTIRQS